MATIKEATQNSMAFAREALGADRIKGLQLEEVESAEEGGTGVWRITLSMIISPDPEQLGPVGAAIAALAQPRREYKIFTVLRQTGEVTSMKIRELQDK